MASGRNTKITGATGEYLVAAEPSRRSFIATTFTDNVPDDETDDLTLTGKDEELNKWNLRQHQTGAVEATLSRAVDPGRPPGAARLSPGSRQRRGFSATAPLPW